MSLPLLHLNSMTKKAYATYVLSVPEIALQSWIPVGPLPPAAKQISTDLCILRENKLFWPAVWMTSSHVAKSITGASFIPPYILGLDDLKLLITVREGPFKLADYSVSPYTMKLLIK